MLGTSFFLVVFIRNCCLLGICYIAHATFPHMYDRIMLKRRGMKILSSWTIWRVPEPGVFGIIFWCASIYRRLCTLRTKNHRKKRVRCHKRFLLSWYTRDSNAGVQWSSQKNALERSFVPLRFKNLHPPRTSYILLCSRNCESVDALLVTDMKDPATVTPASKRSQPLRFFHHQ